MVWSGGLWPVVVAPAGVYCVALLPAVPPRALAEALAPRGCGAGAVGGGLADRTLLSQTWIAAMGVARVVAELLLEELGPAGGAGGSAGSISLSTGQPVALSSRSTGLFLHVSLDDGLLKAGSKTASDKESHFYVVPVTEATVASLRAAAAATAKLASKWEDIKTVSRSGCNCTGFSNEHGFGRYCHAWELSYQE